MPNKKKIIKYLTKITNSDEFAKSQKYQNLLQYLVNSTIQGDIPKEITIAHDVFDKSVKEYQKNGSEVRVYVYNLRKKLDSYYQHEGKNDELKFEIPKGHYQVTFTERKVKKPSLSRNTIIGLNIAIVLIIVIINFFIFKNLRNNFPKSELTNNPLWSNMFSDDNPIMVVLGDYYLYKGENLFGIDRHLYIRDFNINSNSDYEEELNNAEIKNGTIKKTNHTLLGKYAPWSIREITELLYSNNKDFEMKLSSNFQWTDINKYNIIFIGTFKSFGILNDLIADLNFSYQVHPNKLLYYDDEKDSTYTYTSKSSTLNDASENDYSAIVKLQTSEETSITIFGSTRDIGCIAMVKYLTEDESLSKFENKYDLESPKNQYFEAIFKIQGFERNVNKIDILHFDNINPE